MTRWTRERIIHAFSELVAERSYDEVSVEMILRRAEVSKTTFYRYFCDKAAVMDARFQMLYDEAVISNDCRSLQDLFATLLKQARMHPDQYAMFSTSGYNSYREFIYRYTYSIGKEIMESAWHRQVTDIEDFHIAYFCAGGSKILQEWCEGKRFTHMTEEEAAREICTMIHQQYLVGLDKTVIEHLKARARENGTK